MERKTTPRARPGGKEISQNVLQKILALVNQKVNIKNVRKTKTQVKKGNINIRINNQSGKAQQEITPRIITVPSAPTFLPQQQTADSTAVLLRELLKDRIGKSNDEILKELRSMKQESVKTKNAEIQTSSEATPEISSAFLATVPGMKIEELNSRRTIPADEVIAESRRKRFELSSMLGMPAEEGSVRVSEGTPEEAQADEEEEPHMSDTAVMEIPQAQKKKNRKFGTVQKDSETGIPRKQLTELAKAFNVSRETIRKFYIQNQRIPTREENGDSRILKEMNR